MAVTRMPANVDLTPMPVDDGQPAGLCVRWLDGAWRTAWARDGGRRLEPFGPPYERIRQALRATAAIRERMP